MIQPTGVPTTKLPGGPSPDEPNWIGEVIEQALERVRPFLTTAQEFTFRPTSFIARWVSGEKFAMNPLLFAAAAVLVISTVRQLVQSLDGSQTKNSLLTTAWLALAPHIYQFEIGCIAHWVVSALGPHRKWASSIAMSLYAGGMADLFGELSLTAGELFRLEASTRAGLNAILAGLFFTLYFTLFAQAMARLHRATIGVMLVANCAALIGSALIGGFVPLPTLQFVIQIWRDGHFVAPSVLLSYAG